MGDFNLQDAAPYPDCKFSTFYRERLDVFRTCPFELTVTSSTRGKHILDLSLTSNHTLIDSVSILKVLVTMTWFR